MEIRPYLALDLETTGLDTEKSHILQIGWVIDDGKSPLDQLEKGSVIVKEEPIVYGETIALGMNGWLFQEMSKKDPKYQVCNLSAGLHKFFYAVGRTSELALEFDKARGRREPSNRIQLAGKNVGPFDWKILSNQEKKAGHDFFNKNLIDHRFIDVGPLFYHYFGRVPGFADINRLIGWKDINHDALDDAINVVVAVRWSAGVPLKGEKND